MGQALFFILSAPGGSSLISRLFLVLIFFNLGICCGGFSHFPLCRPQNNSRGQPVPSPTHPTPVLFGLFAWFLFPLRGSV